MTLMDRIKVVDFLSLSESMQLNFVDTIRKDRAAAVTFALTQKKKGIKKNKVASKSKVKSPRAQANKKAKAEAALRLLTSDQIANLAKLF